MGTGTPLTSITLGAASVADDLGYVALADLAQALGDLTEDYRRHRRPHGHSPGCEMAAGARALPRDR